MNQALNPKLIAICALFFLAIRPLVADTNDAATSAPAPALAPVTAATSAAPVAVTPPANTPPPAPVQPEVTPGLTREEVAENYLQLQEQIHASQLAIEHQQQVAADAATANAAALATRLDTLEQTVARQRVSDAESAHKTQQMTLFMAGAFGLAGLGIMLLMVYFQWRAFTQLAQISSLQHAAIGSANNVHHLAAPGRATVEAANTQLLSAVDRLEQRINELEGGQRYLPELAAAPKVDGIETSLATAALQNHVADRAMEKLPDLLSEGQRYLDDNAPQRALECFDRYLASHPDRGEGLVKRASALEKLGREEEAINCYNRAIAVDSTLVIAHLHKGGLLNRLRRYDEALNCYEAALQAQEKKPALAR